MVYVAETFLCLCGFGLVVCALGLARIAWRGGTFW
jgi:hypothetical protein